MTAEPTSGYLASLIFSYNGVEASVGSNCFPFKWERPFVVIDISLGPPLMGDFLLYKGSWD